MCTQCVAQALPYVGMAAGGLRVMTWNAGRARRAAGTAAEPSEDGTVDRDDEAVSVPTA